MKSKKMAPKKLQSSKAGQTKKQTKKVVSKKAATKLQSSKAGKPAKKSAPVSKKAPKTPAPKKLQSSKAGTVRKTKIEVIKPSTSKVVAKKAPNLATKLGLFDNCVKRGDRIFLKPPREFAEFPDLLSLQKK